MGHQKRVFMNLTFDMKVKMPNVLQKKSKRWKNYELFCFKLALYSIKVAFQKWKIWSYKWVLKVQNGVFVQAYISNDIWSWKISHTIKNKSFENVMGTGHFVLELQEVKIFGLNNLVPKWFAYQNEHLLSKVFWL